MATNKKLCQKEWDDVFYDQNFKETLLCTNNRPNGRNDNKLKKIEAETIKLHTNFIGMNAA